MTRDDVDPVLLAERAAGAVGSGTDFESRTMYLVGSVDAEMLYRFVANFHVLDSSPGRIKIFLSSMGGDELAGYGIYDVLKRASNDTVVEGYGAVQSIAALILQAADERLLSAQARFMIHNGSIDLSNDMDTNILVSIGREAAKGNRTYQRLLAERSVFTTQEVAALCQAETYYSAREAVRYGFADRVIPRSRR